MFCLNITASANSLQPLVLQYQIISTLLNSYFLLSDVVLGLNHILSTPKWFFADVQTRRCSYGHMGQWSEKGWITSQIWNRHKNQHWRLQWWVHCCSLPRTKRYAVPVGEAPKDTSSRMLQYWLIEKEFWCFDMIYLSGHSPFFYDGKGVLTSSSFSGIQH